MQPPPSAPAPLPAYDLGGLAQDLLDSLQGEHAPLSHAGAPQAGAERRPPVAQQRVVRRLLNTNRIPTPAL